MLRNCIVAAMLVASASAFAPMGVLPCTRGRAASLQLRKPAGALHMAGGPPASVVKMLDFQSKVMGVVYKIQGKEKPFTLQMRDAAMALHTFSQAPREGKVRDETADTVVSPIPGPQCALALLPPAQPPQRARISPRHSTAMRSATRRAVRTASHARRAGQVEQWEASQSEFMQFLVDSGAVYQSFDEMVVKPEYNIFENSGLERVEAINKDIKLINSKWGIAIPKPNQAATDYAQYIKTLSPEASPPFPPTPYFPPAIKPCPDQPLSFPDFPGVVAARASDGQ